MSTARQWLIALTLGTFIVLVMGGLLVGLAELAPKPYDDCPSEQWAQEVESALTAVVPADSRELGSYTWDCDDDRSVEVGYVPSRSVKASIKSVTTAAPRQGWVRRTTDPDGDCFERTVRDLETSMEIYVEDGEIILLGTKGACR